MTYKWGSPICLSMVLFAFLSITVTANAGSNVNVQLTGAGGAENGLGANYAYGEYLMPYYLTINFSNPIAVVCDDFLHTVSVGDTWTATLSTFANLSQTRFGSADSTEYHEAAWIASQIHANSSLTDIAGAQFAIWRLFTAGVPDVGTEDAWLAAAQAAKGSSYYGMNFSNVEILTPLNPLSPQEYFFFIPEPNVLLDLGMGLVAFVTVWGSRRRRLV
jgi:hypothetical protein